MLHSCWSWPYNTSCLAVRSGNKSSNHETGLGNRGGLKVLLILNEHRLLPKLFGINLVLFRTFRHPLFPKPVSWLRLFFAASYSKIALGINLQLQKDSGPIVNSTCPHLTSPLTKSSFSKCNCGIWCITDSERLKNRKGNTFTYNQILPFYFFTIFIN